MKRTGLGEGSREGGEGGEYPQGVQAFYKNFKQIFPALWVQSSTSRVQSPESRVQSPEYNVQSFNSRVRTPKSRVQSPESGVQSQ